MAEGNGSNGDRMLGAWIRQQAVASLPWIFRGMILLGLYGVQSAVDHVAARFDRQERGLVEISARLTQSTHEIDRRLVVEERRSTETERVLGEHGRRIESLEFTRGSPAGPIPTMPRPDSP